MERSQPTAGGSVLATLEAHPNKKDDLYFNFGSDAFRTAYTNAAGTAGIGYGSPLFNNTGCNTEVLPGANPSPAVVPGGTLNPANAETARVTSRNIMEGTFGFWHRFYNGPKGRLQFGLQYSYLMKNTWSGNNSNATFRPGAQRPRQHGVHVVPLLHPVGGAPTQTAFRKGRTRGGSEASCPLLFGRIGSTRPIVLVAATFSRSC